VGFLFFKVTNKIANIRLDQYTQN